MRQQLVAQNELDQAKIDALAFVYEKADSTLAGRNIEVKVTAAYGQAPAWSKNGTITLNAATIGGVHTPEDMVSVTGLNFHELAHELYTPNDSMFDSLLMSEGLYSLFNILEDQRIETLLIAEYRPLKPYFVMAVMKHIASDAEAAKTAHGLLYGRKYLPGNIRDFYKSQFIFKNRKEIEKVIDEYLTVVYPQDKLRALDLIREFKRLLYQNDAQPGSDPHGHSNEKPSNRTGSVEDADAKAAKQQAQSSAQAKVEELDQESQAEGQGNGQGQGEGEGDPSGEASDGQGQSGNGSDTGNGKAAGSGTGDPQDFAAQQIEKQMNTDQVISDLNQQRRAVTNQIGKIPRLPLRGFKVVTASQQALAARNRFRRELERLWVDADPGWDSHKSSGRVNIRRAMHNMDVDTVFDQWNEGKQDANDIELVIAADYSGSMRQLMRPVSEGIWLIKSAVEAVNGEVTVMGYESSGSLFYSRHDKAEPNTYRQFGSQGGTNPHQVIHQARVLFHGSQRKHKIMIFLTDGEWDSADASEQQIKRLNDNGVLTALAYIEEERFRGRVSDSHRHECQLFKVIETVDDFVGMARNIVKGAMK